MTNCKIEYENLEQNLQRQELSSIFLLLNEELFENLETTNVDISTANFIIEHFSNKKVGNTCHYQNGPNQRQHIHKTTARQYQSRYFHRPTHSSITYLKEYFRGRGINNKVVI